MSCASKFLGAQCQKHAGHNGVHFARDPSGYTTVWTDPAADIDCHTEHLTQLGLG